MSESEHSVQFLPWITNSGWTYWPATRIVIAVSFGGAAFAALMLGMLPIAIAVGLIGFGLIVKATNNRQFTYQLLAQIYESWKENRRAKKRGPHRSRELKQVLFVDDHGNTSKISMEPVQPQFIPLDGGKAGYLTEIHTPFNGRHTQLVFADGHGRAVASNPEGMKYAADAVASVLQEASLDYGARLFGSLFYMRVPTNPEEAIAYYDRMGITPTDRSMTLLRSNYIDALGRQIDSSGDLQAGIGISVMRPKSWNRASSPDKLSLDDINKSAGYNLTSTIVERLQAIGVTRPRLPNPYEATVLIRGSLDVTTIEDVYRDWQADKKKSERGELRSFSDSLVMNWGMLPEDWSPHHTYLRIGDSYTRMFFVSGYPNPYVEAGLMENLFSASQDIWYGISILYETTDASREKIRNKYRRNTADTKRIRNAAKGSSASAEELEAEQLTRDADALLHRGGGNAVKLNTLAYVSSSSLDGLQEAEIALRKVFRTVELPLQRVTGRSLQVPVRLAMLGIRSDKV